MKKLLLVFFISALVIGSITNQVSAEDVLYITRPTIVEAPQALPRYDGSLWNMDFRYNPALLSLDCPYDFIYDIYYLGGYRNIETGAYGSLNFPSATDPYSSRHSDMDYYAHGLGTDVGFALRLNDRANLAAIFGYRWDHVSGDGEFHDYWERLESPNPTFGYFDGSTDENFEAHTFALSLLLSYALNDRVTVGAGLKYAYTFEEFETDMTGLGARIPYPAGTPHYENATIDRDLVLRYHRIAPVIGISLKPSPAFTLDASVEAGFYLGDVHKDSVLFDDFRITGPPPSGQMPWIPSALDTYTEDLDSSVLSGWDIAAKVNPEIILSDALSIPITLTFDYRDFRWGVDGTSTGYFATYNLLDVSLGPGTIDYESFETSWDISAEGGVKYRAGWGTLTGLIGYTHSTMRYGYDVSNQITAPSGTTLYNGLAIDILRDKETRDILSLTVLYEREFSPMLAADFGLRYDLGWGYRKVDSTISSRFEFSPPVPPTLRVSADGRDIYQDLTLTTHLTFRPAEHLEIALGGMVKIPLDKLDYNMDGEATGLGSSVAAIHRRPGYFFDGPFSMGYESTGWDWGGLLSITYEFGCPVAAPPAPEPAPVIEPKIEPMSLK